MTSQSSQRHLRMEGSLPPNYTTKYPYFFSKGVQLDVGSNTTNAYSVDNKWESVKIGDRCFEPRVKFGQEKRVILNLAGPSDNVSEDSSISLPTHLVSEHELETFSSFTPWESILPQAQSTQALIDQRKTGLVHTSFYSSFPRSRSVTPSEFIPNLKTPTLKFNQQDKGGVPHIKAQVQIVFALGHMQTATDLRANKDSKPVLCFSSGPDNSVFEIYYQSRTLLKVECESKILKIVPPVFSEVALVYSDHFGLVLENGNVMVLKILEVYEEKALFVRKVFQKSQFQSNNLVDVVFSPFDKNQAAFMDCVGNWCLMHLKQTGSTLKLVLLRNVCGSMFDPEELDSIWRRVIWSKEHDKLLLFDETKIVSASLNGNTDLLQLSENKTWSRIHDVAKVGNYLVCLTTMEIQILHMNGSGLLSKAFSWKHYFHHEQSLELSAVSSGNEYMYVGIHLKNTSVLFFYQFLVSRNEPIRVTQSPVYVDFGNPLECFEVVCGDLGTYFADEKAGTSLPNVDFGVLYKLQGENEICYMDVAFDKGHNYFLPINHERTHFNLCIPRASFNFLRVLDSKIKGDGSTSAPHNTIDEVEKYENYGLVLESHVSEASMLPFVKSLSRFEIPHFDVNDSEEFLSFIEQIGKHFNCKYPITEIKSLLSAQLFTSKASEFEEVFNSISSAMSLRQRSDLSVFLKTIVLDSLCIFNLTSLKAKNKDDTKNLNFEYQSLLAEWSLNEAVDPIHKAHLELNSLNHTNTTLRLQTEKQLPEIRLSQSSQSSNQKRKQERVQESQVSGFGSQNFNQASLPSSMPPGFSLVGSQQALASQQSSRSQPTKKRKKRAKGFF